MSQPIANHSADTPGMRRLPWGPFAGLALCVPLAVLASRTLDGALGVAVVLGLALLQALLALGFLMRLPREPRWLLALLGLILVFTLGLLVLPTLGVATTSAEVGSGAFSVEPGADGASVEEE